MIREICESDAKLLASAKKEFSDAWNEEMILSAFRGGRFFGLVDEEKDGFSFITYSLSIDTADIEDVFTSASLRRQGKAKNLLKLALEKIKGAGKERVLLEVKSTNLSAQKLYESFGFKVISVRKNYYPDGDAFVMEKEL